GSTRGHGPGAQRSRAADHGRRRSWHAHLQGSRDRRDRTGEIGPPTAGSSALEMDANSEDMTGLKQEVLPDGSVMVDLQGRFQESMVMQIDANGHSFTTCTRDVKKTLAHAPATSQTPQREERSMKTMIAKTSPGLGLPML